MRNVMFRQAFVPKGTTVITKDTPVHTDSRKLLLPEEADFKEKVYGTVSTLLKGLGLPDPAKVDCVKAVENGCLQFARQAMAPKPPSDKIDVPAMMKWLMGEILGKRITDVDPAAAMGDFGPVMAKYGEKYKAAVGGAAWEKATFAERQALIGLGKLKAEYLEEITTI